MLKESAFSKRLKDLRKKAGLKQVELADLSGIDPNLVSRYERGESMPTLETAQKLALSLGINIGYLLNEQSKQEFEVKILMGVKTLPNVAGIEITDNSFIYGVDDEKPQIHIGGMINIGTQQERKESLKKIIVCGQKKSKKPLAGKPQRVNRMEYRFQKSGYTDNSRDAEAR